MNIALFLDCFTPMKNGVITSVLQLKEGLEKRNHHVVIVTVDAKGNTNEDPNILMFPLIPMDFGSKQGFGPAAVNRIKLIRFLKEHKIDLIHVHTEFSLGLAARYAALKLKIPRIATTHTMWEQYTNYSFLLKIKPLLRIFLRYYFMKTQAIIAPSVKIEKYDRRLAPKIPVFIIPNGIDVNRFRPADLTEQDLINTRKQYGIGADDRLLIFVGRLGPEKRVEPLFDSIVPVIRKNPNIKMIYVGDGPDHQKLMEKASKLGLEKSFIFTGFIDWSHAFRLYSIAHIFVTASLSEVHPMTLIESTMCGLPSIARRDDSCLDLILEDMNGYLADTDEDLSRKVERLISDENLLKKFSANALEISRQFTADVHVDKVEKLYKEILDAYETRHASRRRHMTAPGKDPSVPA